MGTFKTTQNHYGKVALVRGHKHLNGCVSFLGSWYPRTQGLQRKISLFCMRNYRNHAIYPFLQHQDSLKAKNWGGIVNTCRPSIDVTGWEGCALLCSKRLECRNALFSCTSITTSAIIIFLYDEDIGHTFKLSQVNYVRVHHSCLFSASHYSPEW